MTLSIFGKKKPPESGLLVLHIDDSKWVRIPVAVLLRKHFGITVLEADNGADGIVLAQTKRPDMILLDVMMPQMDGFDTLIKLKESPKTKNIPVLMVTSRDVMREVNMALRLGAAGYLTKPIEEDRLVSKIKETLIAMGKSKETARHPPAPLDPLMDLVQTKEDVSAPVSKACPACQKPLEFVETYAQWYCRTCRQYA